MIINTMKEKSLPFAKMSNTAGGGGGGFPGSVTTSTTTKVTPLIWFDATYLNNKDGQIKAACVVSFFPPDD